MTVLSVISALGLVGSLLFAGWCCWDCGYDKGWDDRDAEERKRQAS